MKKNYILNITNNQTIIKEETAYQSSISDIAKKPLSATLNTMKGAIKDTFNVGTYITSLATNIFSKNETRKAIRSNFIARQKEAEALYGKAFSEVQDQTGLNILTFATNPSMMFSLYGANKIKDEVKENILDDPNFKQIFNFTKGPKAITDWLLGKSSARFNKVFADSPSKIFQNVFTKRNFKLYDEYGNGYYSPSYSSTSDSLDRMEDKITTFKKLIRKGNFENVERSRLSADERYTLDLINRQKRELGESNNKSSNSFLIIEKEKTKVSPVKADMKTFKEIVKVVNEIKVLYKEYNEAVSKDITNLSKNKEFQEEIKDFFSENEDSLIKSADIAKDFENDISSMITLTNLQIKFVHTINGLFNTADEFTESNYNKNTIIDSLKDLENKLSQISASEDSVATKYISKVKDSFINAIQQISSQVAKTSSVYELYVGLLDKKLLQVIKELPNGIKGIVDVIEQSEYEKEIEDSKSNKTLSEEVIQKLEEKYNTVKENLKSLEEAGNKISQVNSVISSLEEKIKVYLSKQQTESGEDEQG